MGKKYKLWPDSNLDQLMADFFARKGIDPNDVLHYEIQRAAGGQAQIKITMHYDEGPPPETVSPAEDWREEYLKPQEKE